MNEKPKDNHIGNYEMLRFLGKGASASVYEALDKTEKMKVAIKMIDQEHINFNNLRDRVEQEAAIQIRLEHPSILKLYDRFEDSQYVYLILELCPNGNMQQYLDSHGKALTEDEARVVMHQVVEGLRYLHRNGIVHRDLSLANLLLTEDVKVKISDFGIAIVLKEDSNQQHNTICGTPNFMSPEMASGKGHDKTTDVWSLGVILYVCLVGKRPFESTGVCGTLGQVRKGKYKLPNTLSPEASDLIIRMLCGTDDRISLEDIMKHPFMRSKSTPALMTKKVVEMSMDSGCGTSTKHSSSSSHSNMYAPSRRTQPMRAFPLQQETHREEDRAYMSIDSGAGSTRSQPYSSQSSSASGRHPPSPPVRERDSQSEEELRRTQNAMRSIKFQSKQRNIFLAARGEAEAKPGIQGSWNEQSTAANCGASDAAEAATGHMQFSSLPSNDHQKVERQYQAFDPCRYKDPDCTSSYTNSAFRLVQHNDRTDKYERSLCEVQQPQQTSQIPSVYPENMQTQDLASKVYNFLAKDETQQRLKRSQPVEFVYNKVPIQFSSPEPASRNIKLTEQEIQHCLLGSNKTAPKSDQRDSKELYSLPPPFSTEGLTPVREKSKSSVLHIMENGSVLLEFTKKGTVETVTDVITINSDGMRMMRYKPAVAVPVRDRPLLLPPSEHCETFLYPKIPEKHVKKYRYAAKMVKLLRDKKPKLTLYACRAKCILMENKAFHMEFYDGVTAVSDDQSVIIKQADGTSLTVSSAKFSPSLSSETLELLTYLQQCKYICLKVEEAISHLQALVPADNRLFPITLGRRPGGIKSAHKNVRALYSNKMKLGQKAVSDTTTLKSTLSKTPETTTSTNSSSITSSPGLDRSSANVRLKTNQGSISDQRKVGDSAILKGSHLSVTASRSPNTAAAAISRENSSPSSDNGLAHVELRGANVSETFMPGVGWALKNVKGEIEMRFQDGTRMDLMKTVFIYWTRHRRSCCEYRYEDDPLPDEVRKKLTQAAEMSKILDAESRAKPTSVLSSSSSR